MNWDFGEIFETTLRYASKNIWEDAHARLRKKWQTEVGFYDLPEKIGIEPVSQLAGDIRKNYDGAILFGIGGSFLGPASVLAALSRDEENFSIEWVSNIDTHTISRARALAKKRKMAAIVISKSGSTLETLSVFFHLASEFDPKGIVVITDPRKGELRRLASQKGWRTLEIPENIGGRFSVLSAAGLFPIALGGIDAKGLIKGSRTMRETFEKSSASENPAFRFGFSSFALDTHLKKSIQYLMPYGSHLKLLADWYVQLWAESLGKKQKGFTPVSAVGTSDQHSILQLLKEGPADKVVGFLGVKPSSDGLKIGKPPWEVDDKFSYLFEKRFDDVLYRASVATQKSLSHAGVPTYRIDFDALSPESLGSFFFFMETACAFAGECYGINAYDQPGVEESKRLLGEMLGATQ